MMDFKVVMLGDLGKCFTCLFSSSQQVVSG